MTILDPGLIVVIDSGHKLDLSSTFQPRAHDHFVFRYKASAVTQKMSDLNLVAPMPTPEVCVGCWSFFDLCSIDIL
jgi:hypothetical protein